ncbi:hypothetical protein BGS_0082 [Beggiatoa sp. SS]|nr:hypothetical protein BGS_0082 [Beggiatoa sp. SS]
MVCLPIALSQLPTEGTLNLSPLLGTWINTNLETDHIIKVVTDSSGDGALTVHIYGANSPNPIDWGVVKATPFGGGKTMEAIGFHAHYDFGSIETHLVSNQKLGILVIQSYSSFKDDSGRPNHFARGFFHILKPK